MKPLSPVVIYTVYAAERKPVAPVVAILRIDATTKETQVTGVGTGLHSVRPIEPIVTCAVQSARSDVPSADEE